MSARPASRRRASSVSKALDQIPLNEGAHMANVPESPTTSSTPTSPTDQDPLAHVLTTPGTPSIQLNGSETSFYQQEAVLRDRRAAKAVAKGKTSESHGLAGSDVVEKVKAKAKKGRKAVGRFEQDEDDVFVSGGFWEDCKTGRWMVVPSSSLKLCLIPIILHLIQSTLLPVSVPNPWKAMITITHKIDKLAGGELGGALVGQQLFERGWNDYLFIIYHIVFFSFVRQGITLHVLRPYGKYLGIPKGKMERFTEQGYAICYFGFFGCLGLYVMRGLPTWWYKTAPMFNTFPVLEMPRLLKSYYLWQFSYWLQQTILLAAGVEKPRKDFRELVVHHIVTLWLVGWSYYLTFTYIGTAIFVTMDISDVFLALAKCVNYWREEYSAPPFAFFVVVWSYFRHYQNIRILWSLWFEFKLIPAQHMQGFAPWRQQFAPAWIRNHIFAPILLLQLINIFWYFLILRILFRAIFGQNLADDRSDDEGGEIDGDELEEIGDVNHPADASKL